MSIIARQLLTCLFGLVFISITCVAQTPVADKQPSKPIRPYVVMTGQSLADLDKKLQPSNKVEELIGGPGMELRVAVQHEQNIKPAMAELHDASDDVYYVLSGSATLTLGGALDTPKEVEPGEWRGPKIAGGQLVNIRQGDLIVVPRGTPHQRSTADQNFTMILIKVFADPRPPAPTPKP